MVSVETVISAALALLLINAVLEVTVIACWYRRERPKTPLLKPATLCAATLTLCRCAVLVWRYIYCVHALEVTGRVRKREQILLRDLQERSQDNV